MFRACDEFKQERLPAETRIASASVLGSESVDLEGHIREGGCEWWRTNRQSETLQNSLGGIRWMDGRENFHRAAAHFALENVHQEDSFHQFGPCIVAWVRFCRHGRRHFRFNIPNGFLKRFGTRTVCAGFIRRRYDQWSPRRARPKHAVVAR